MKLNYLKPLLMVFAICMFANNLYAQGAYVNINAGYGASMSSGNINYFNFYNTTRILSPDIRTSEQINLSLGSGANIGGTVGYMFNKNVGVELGISYLVGDNSKAKDIYIGGTTDYTLSSNMVRLTPTLVIAAGFEKINPYAKFGLVVGSGSIMYQYVDNDVADGDLTVQKEKLDGGLAFGLNAGAGVLFNINNGMSFFGEINMVNLSYAPTKGEITESTLNGVNELATMTTKERTTVFVASYDRNAPSPDSQPRQRLSQLFPFGSLGLNLGVRFNL